MYYYRNQVWQRREKLGGYLDDKEGKSTNETNQEVTPLFLLVFYWRSKKKKFGSWMDGDTGVQEGGKDTFNYLKDTGIHSSRGNETAPRQRK